MLRRPFIVALALTMLLIAALSACDLGNSTAPASPTPSAADNSAVVVQPTATVEVATPTPTSEAQQGGQLTIRIANNVERLTPWDLNSRGAEYAAQLMYNGLVRLDAQARPQPDLAERWEPSPDGGTITFTLRSGVRWHDGEPFTAEDAAWTLNTLRTITPTTSLLFDLRSVIGQVETPDEQTVVLRLNEPYAPLLADLAVPILPRHRFPNRSPEQIAATNFWDVPVGTGPFRFDRREGDQAILWTRNGDFYRGAPYLDGAALLIAPDRAVAADAFARQDLLVAEWGGPTEAITDITLPVTATRGIYNENGWYGVVFNVREGRVFSDAPVREALARAVDVPALVRDVVGEGGAPIATTIVTNTWAYPEQIQITPPNLDEARQILDSAGWAVGRDNVRERNGERLAAQLFVRGDDRQRVQAAERIAAAAREIGIGLEVVPSNFDTVILAKLAPPYDFDILLGSWVNTSNSAGFPTNYFYDPDDYALFHSGRVWQGDSDTRTALRNVGGFRNSEYDAAAEHARRTYDVSERAAAIAEAQTVLARERPYVYLWSNRFRVALNGRLRSVGEPIDPNGPRYLWNVEEWYLAREEP